MTMGKPQIFKVGSLMALMNEDVRLLTSANVSDYNMQLHPTSQHKKGE